ncbi:MAG: hypothetical protein Q8L48_13480 [Archangium sp.]|nr:hypothetical protein [Archangium sp.]
MLTMLLLGQLVAGDGTGTGPAPIPEEVREAPRIRGGVHFAVAGGFSGFAPGFGPGLCLEVGATFADRYSLVARATVGTIVVANVGSIALGVDVALWERVSLGAGVSIAFVGGFVDMPASIAVFAPLRVVFSPFPRSPDDRWRSGLSLFAEAGPGYGLIMSAGFFGRGAARPSPMSAVAAIGIGYAWW